MGFRKDFVWGAATSSYQIEGAWNVDGKGESVCDMVTHTPGIIFGNHTGDTACDHYHRYKDDVALMSAIALQAYRFSVSWPRVLPNGIGRINEKGLGFYDKLVDELLAANIEPWLTLFHWDYPYELFLRGGWLNPDSPKWFADYTAVIVDRLSDRVSKWMTINEPQCYIGSGHWQGWCMPGLKLCLREMLLANHHTMMAHGAAVQVIRTRAKKAPLVGWAPVGTACAPESDSPADREAAMQAMGSVGALDVPFTESIWNNTWWADPVILGHYPEDGLKFYGNAAPKGKASDFELMCQPLDFYGCNIYQGNTIRAGVNGKPEVVASKAGEPTTLMWWRVVPELMYWGTKFLSERYKLPIVITENGFASPDWVGIDGKIHDGARIDYLRSYLRQLRRAAKDGIDIAGYFQWSLMDNFEWWSGYRPRFGLIHVDYGTQERTLKDSAYWYREVIAANGENL
jgi:beta-glucosidase